MITAPPKTLTFPVNPSGVVILLPALRAAHEYPRNLKFEKQMAHRISHKAYVHTVRFWHIQRHVITIKAASQHPSHGNTPQVHSTSRGKYVFLRILMSQNLNQVSTVRSKMATPIIPIASYHHKQNYYWNEHATATQELGHLIVKESAIVKKNHW